MARAAKKDTLTLEEKIEQALVPEGEQPYEVPDNWVWTILGNIISVSSGKALTTKKMDTTGETPVYGGNGITGYHSKSNIEAGNIVVGRVGFYCGSVHYISEPAWITDNALIVSFNRNILYTKFLYWLLTSTNLRKNGSSTAQPVISGSKIYKIETVLPPLAEQHRIVDRIESLFAKLDAAKELAQSALDSFETRKAAILHKAFAGELTAKWRDKHGVGMESWEEKTLASVCTSIFDGDHMPPPQCSEGVPFLVISNVNKGVLSFDNTRFVSKEYYDNLSETRKPQMGDVLYTIVGSYGIPVVVDVNRDFCFQRHMALMKPKAIIAKLLWYLLQTSDIYQKATNIATGTAQLTVPIKGLRQLTFNMPTLSEQQEIVRILNDLFAKEQRAREQCDIIDKIDLMKKAILARAFRGQLGTNDPTEESALELLKEVLKEEA